MKAEASVPRNFRTERLMKAGTPCGRNEECHSGWRKASWNAWQQRHRTVVHKREVLAYCRTQIELGLLSRFAGKRIAYHSCLKTFQRVGREMRPGLTWESWEPCPVTGRNTKSLAEGRKVESRGGRWGWSGTKEKFSSFAFRGWALTVLNVSWYYNTVRKKIKT